VRGIRKREPPRDVSAAGQKPRSWQAAVNDLKAALREPREAEPGIAREHFDSLEKGPVRKCLCSEQEYLCIFCECRLRDNGDVRIAHWIPKAKEPKRALDWANLYASCSHEETCDTRQGNRVLGFPSPVELDFGKVLRFSRNGAILVRPEATSLLGESAAAALEKAIGSPIEHNDRASTLNLNWEPLRKARAQAIDGVRQRVQKRYPGRTASKADRKRMADEYLAEGRLTEYISIVLAWLRCEMGGKRH